MFSLQITQRLYATEEWKEDGTALLEMLGQGPRDPVRHPGTKEKGSKS
jgi:hypothetical protein